MPNDSACYLFWVGCKVSSSKGMSLNERWVMFPAMQHIFSCVPQLHWVFQPFITGHPQSKQAHHRLLRPWSLLHGGVHLAPQPQSVTALFDCGEFVNGLPLGFPSDANFLQEPCGGTGDEALAAHPHWTHLYPPALVRYFSCQVGIAQPFLFICLINGPKGPSAQ